MPGPSLVRATAVRRSLLLLVLAVALLASAALVLFLRPAQASHVV